MTIQLEHYGRRYPTPSFARPPEPLEAARSTLLGRTHVTFGADESPQQAIGDHAAALARRYEDLRFHLLERQFLGPPLSDEERAILAAINAALRESMPPPPPESEQTNAAIAVAKRLLAGSAGG